ncbi:EVE domain-containing protein [Fusobacterium sp.]|uniref:EVE domain-containing protein n=1 Tax=Fusobacterium sp. TaxID=68766 RepID=UPI0025BBCF77|nr:EVE domain-containing protein [Fusobacterium sp.]
MINYWIFQYTTNIYKNVIEDFKNETIDKWEVTKHKKNIKIGDKAIIYIGGNKGKIILGVVEVVSNLFFIEEKNRDYVKIKIIENWCNNPISFSIAKKEIPDILIGISGTNFRANEEQYIKLKELV